jgi:hypothetical protein
MVEEYLESPPPISSAKMDALVVAPALVVAVRCSATTNAGKRCRCRTTAENGLCATHAHVAVALVPMKKKSSANYDKFCRSYYNILRELYNVAGDEMEDEFVRFKTLGRAGYNAFHSANFPTFCNHIE